MKNITLFLFALMLSASNLFGQVDKDKFFDLLNKKDTTEALKLLDEWKKKSPDDPEIYVLYFNYYAKNSSLEVLRLDGKPKEGQEALVLQDKDTSNKEPVGYIYDDVLYNPGILKIGFAYIDTGITKFPARLDMRFGKIYMLEQNKDYSHFTKEIINTIDYSPKINNNWTWTNNEPVKDPQNFLLENIQKYIYDLSSAGDDNLFENIKEISEAVLKYYPDNVDCLSNVGTSYIVEKNYDSALTFLLKAEKYAPKDYIVSVNIAKCYLEKGDKKNAKKYYKLVITNGEGGAVDFAKKQIEELNKK